MDTTQPQDIFQRISKLKQQGLNSEQILQQLLETGLTFSSAQQYVDEWKKNRTEKKRNAAFVYCGIGVFLLTTGFLFAVLQFTNNNDFNFALYGLTIIGIILVFKGLIDLMS